MKANYEQIGKFVEEIIKPVGYKLMESVGYKGKPGVNGMREFRIAPVDPKSKTGVDALKKLFDQVDLTDYKFNTKSPNSSKFSSFEFKREGVYADVVVAGGANKGETFEKEFLRSLSPKLGASQPKEYSLLLDMLQEANPAFKRDQIVEVTARKGTTNKKGRSLEDLDMIIADVIVVMEDGTRWGISVKDVNGDTFSSYGGTATLFDSTGQLNDKSEGAEIVNSFGIDLNDVQRGYDDFTSTKKPRKKLINPKSKLDLKELFQHAWGVNYFYVRRMTGGRWKVFWLDHNKLNKLTSNLKVTEVMLPQAGRKQITIKLGNSHANYKVEIRNSKGGIYPNDMKFKILQLK